jgi:hypothetical protein
MPQKNPGMGGAAFAAPTTNPIRKRNSKMSFESAIDTI